LNLDRALHRLDDAGELGDYGIAPGIHDPPVMALDQSCNGRAIATQRRQRSRLVFCHETGISVHIGAQDGGQPPFHLVVGHCSHDSLTRRRMHEASAVARTGFLLRPTEDLAPGRKTSSGMPRNVGPHDTRSYWPTVT